MIQTRKATKILIVDDQPKVVRFVEIDLKLRGFQVTTATCGPDALEMVKSIKPDVLLLDIVMPEMDGIEVLRRLRQFSQVPVIAFSASHGSHDEALKVGANDFMAKPFRPDDLVQRIHALMKA